MADTEMPRYKCHKEVWALKIKALVHRTLTPADKGFGVVTLSEEYMSRHNPRVGGYYVKYADGYESFSPAKVFEEGYEPVK